MQIRLLSDVHVNFYDTSEPLIKKLNSKIQNVDSENEVLIIAGDVGIATNNGTIVPKYLEILKYFRSRWKKIIYVPGNHEFYYSELSIPQINDMISNECEKLGIEYLNKDVYKLGDYTILGCCLWSNVNEAQWNKMKHKFLNLNHSKFIELWKSHTEWLDRTLSKTEGKVMVVTHYLPTKKLIVGKYKGSENKISNTAYYSDLEWLIQKHSNKIGYWFCGHSHVTNLITIGDTILYLNPLGNPKDEHETELYKETLTIV